MIEEIERQANGDIITRVVPEESYFSYGRSHWRLRPLSAQASRIELSAELTPRVLGTTGHRSAVP